MCTHNNSGIRMTDLAKDPEFLRIYHSADKEWPGYEVLDGHKSSLPLLISEIYRLIPHIGSRYVHFHPKNMPDVKIDKVEMIGIVTNKTEMMKYTSYTVDDSTGAIPVLCNRKEVHRDRSTTAIRSGSNVSSGCANPESEMRAASGVTPDTPYERHIQNLWRCARHEKPLHDKIALYDYVHVIGFCGMSFRHQKDVSELTLHDISLGRLFFFGLNVRRISEADHNAMMRHLITDVAMKRYRKPHV